jgi:hypothetical protein
MWGDSRIGTVRVDIVRNEFRSRVCGGKLVPLLKPTAGLARNGDLVECKLGISGSGWLVRSKFKEML